MHPNIRQEQPADYNAVYDLHHAAFKQEDEARLVDALRKNTTAFIPELSLVASINNTVVGHILFTKINIISSDGKVFESLALAPVGVSPSFQKTGIGGQLINAGIAKAKALGFTSVIVLGHEHYYPKFGFVPAEKWGIKAPFEIPPEVFMGLELVENGLENISGTVQYPKEFEAV
ncbi:GNAT family N-acetyltransferase [Chitinophaga arvensicola]|uniref:Predicted N-acetyltransferase YhbS n=1 Tax=Chitinophaga arvensicola TaxID=29529 RepID=A0A1I0SAP9_9BACT|nr:N-acetyltransferase [Chitinophaga arvensicola]SEW53445.1 Predicted N-acetyltransferase YhbS [Chitinophaga arvensicola]